MGSSVIILTQARRWCAIPGEGSTALTEGSSSRSQGSTGRWGNTGTPRDSVAGFQTPTQQSRGASLPFRERVPGPRWGTRRGKRCEEAGEAGVPARLPSAGFNSHHRTTFAHFCIFKIVLRKGNSYLFLKKWIQAGMGRA